MSKAISLHDHRMRKIIEGVDKKIKKSNEDFSFIIDELLDHSVQEGNTNLSDVVKTVWSLAKRMDQIEVEIIKLKLTILEARYNDNKEGG